VEEAVKRLLVCLALVPVVLVPACDSSRPATSGQDPDGGGIRPDGGATPDTSPPTPGSGGGGGAPVTSPDGGAGGRTGAGGVGTGTGGSGGAAVVSRRAAWAGVYDADGVWDLSGPITAQRTLGDIVTDLLIDEIVSRAGVPSALEDRAKDAVRSLVGSKVKTLVDTAAPAPLKPGSDLMMKLATVLASTGVASTIDLVTASAGARAGEELAGRHPPLREDRRLSGVDDYGLEAVERFACQGGRPSVRSTFR